MAKSWNDREGDRRETGQAAAEVYEIEGEVRGLMRASDFLEAAGVDWNEVRNVEELKEQLNL